MRGIILASLEVRGERVEIGWGVPRGCCVHIPLYGETKWFEKAGIDVEMIYIFFPV